MSNSKLANRKLHISLSGLIGAGKTTLATKLAKKLNLPLYEEHVVDNKLLADFYKDMKKYSFRLQISLLNNRYMQQQSICWDTEGGIQDRTLEEDTAFARLLTKQNMMDESELSIYLNLVSIMKKNLTPPDIVIHLRVSPKECLRRIKLRGREMEKGITLEYLELLNNEYNIILREMSPTLVIDVPWENFEDDLDVIVDKLEKTIKSHSNIISLVN